MSNRRIIKFQDIYNNNFRFVELFTKTTYEALNTYQQLWFNLIKPIGPLKSNLSKKTKNERFEGIHKKGNRLLEELYELGKFDHTKGLNMYEIGKRIGFEKSETEEIVDNLSRAELIRHDKSSDEIFITPYGIMMNNGEIRVGYAPVH